MTFPWSKTLSRILVNGRISEYPNHYSFYFTIFIVFRGKCAGCRSRTLSLCGGRKQWCRPSHVILRRLSTWKPASADHLMASGPRCKLRRSNTCWQKEQGGDGGGAEESSKERCEGWNQWPTTHMHAHTCAHTHTHMHTHTHAHMHTCSL